MFGWLDFNGFSGSGYGLLDLDWLFSGIWIWTLDLDLIGFFRIWIRLQRIWMLLDFLGSGPGLWIWIWLLSKDIGVRSDVKIHICSAYDSGFRAPVVFLRRLVVLSGYLDFLTS